VSHGARSGAPLSGLSEDQLSAFAAGKDRFQEVDDEAEGLGPAFNLDSCGGCHSRPATGGASAILETRFGRVSDGVFDPLVAQGGSL
jgi:hypothetical protein